MTKLHPASASADPAIPDPMTLDPDATQVFLPGASALPAAPASPASAAPVAQQAPASTDAADDDDDQVTRILPPPAARRPHTAAASDLPLDRTPVDIDKTQIIGQPPPAATPEPTRSPSNPPSRPASFTSAAVGASTPATPDPGAPMRQVGRYLILQRLGRGGMATVYRAHDPEIGRDVAIKFLHASMCEDDECRTRFVREARAAGGLSHPNIVTVHDVGEIDGRPFMAMEVLEGQSLAEVLEVQHLLPIRDVVTLGIELARALEYAHGRGIVHRDIKPGNIMLLADKSGIKVTDFGIAHMEQAGMQQQTLVGAVLGTPQYMSPEQARGEKLDGRSDLFSVGIVLYQALTGERPFKGDNMVAVAQQIASAEAPPLASRRPDTPPTLRRVVEKCLAKQPAQRFAAGADLARALRNVAVEMDAAQAQKERPRIMPLRVKWALTMAGIVAVVMGLSAAVITQRQYSALMAQAGDYGAAFTRFIANQNAAQMLNEEWEVVDIAVQETQRTRSFERITFIDKAGIVRASTVPGLAGQPYRAPAAEPMAALAGGVTTSRYQAGGASVLGFEAPVMYRDQQVGRVLLGVPEQPLAQVARLSLTLMAVLALVTVLAVALAMYFVANWFAQPIKLVVESMGELARGHYGHRIAEVRKDEFGELFSAFDRLAAALQRRSEDERTATLPPTAVAAVPLPAEQSAKAQHTHHTHQTQPAQPAATAVQVHAQSEPAQPAPPADATQPAQATAPGQTLQADAAHAANPTAASGASAALLT